MASSLAQELRSIQKLLLTSGGTVAAATAASPLPRRRPPTQQTSSSDVESDSEEAPVVTKRRPRKIASAPKQSSQEVLDLERTVAALREQAAGADDRAARLQEALDAARQDGAVVGQRLRAELDVKAEEVRAVLKAGARPHVVPPFGSSCRQTETRGKQSFDPLPSTVAP